MATNAYPYGSRINMKVSWRNPLIYALVDPTGVLAKIVRPTGGAVITYTYGADPEIIKVSAGVFQTHYDCSAKGDWTYRFEASGSHVGAGERKFAIRGSEFYP